MDTQLSKKQHSPCHSIIIHKNLSHDKSIEREKKENQPVCIVKELGFRPKLLLYGDIVFDSDSLDHDQGQMFCENSQFQGIKQCTQIIKTKDFFHFDVSNQTPQIVDFSFLSQYVREKELPFAQELADKILHYSDRVKALHERNQQLNATSRFDDLCLKNPLYSLTTVFQKTEEILQTQLKSTPLVHYQLFRKTGEFFSMIRGGLSLEGIRQFGVDIEAVTQSMLRRSCLPIWRNDKGYILNMRSLQKLDIDFVQYAKKNIQLSQLTSIIIKNAAFTLHEHTQVIALCPFIDEQSDCNYYLHLHTLQFIPAGRCNSITDQQLGEQGQTSHNKINNIQQTFQNPSELFSYSGESISRFDQDEQEQDGEGENNQEITQEFKQEKQHKVSNYAVDMSALCKDSESVLEKSLKLISKESKSDSALSLSESANRKGNIPEWSSDNLNNDGVSSASNEKNEEMHQECSNNSNNIKSCKSPQATNPNESNKKDSLNYKRKVQEFISTFYENSGKEKQEKEQFDKVLKQMLTKKQKLLKVQLL